MPSFHYSLQPQSRSEDLIWDLDIKPLLIALPSPALRGWSYCFPEMLNNAFEHSEGRQVSVSVSVEEDTTDIVIQDDGVGIFSKIQAALGLEDLRLAPLELAKGRLTTAAAQHSGEGIYFSSRLCDRFSLVADGLFYGRQAGEPEQWILDGHINRQPGTTVRMTIMNQTNRDPKSVFDQFQIGTEFSRTVIPIRVAQYSADTPLASRSQARRLVHRLEEFNQVILDFKNVSEISQSFADEVFRVFPLRHPEVDLSYINAVWAVERWIKHAESKNNA